MNRSDRFRWILFVTLGLTGPIHGCATPDYLLPGGYSSTYHKAIQGEYRPLPTPLVAPSTAPEFSPH